MLTRIIEEWGKKKLRRQAGSQCRPAQKLGKMFKMPKSKCQTSTYFIDNAACWNLFECHDCALHGQGK